MIRSMRIICILRACALLPARTPRAATQDLLGPYIEAFRCVTDVGFVPGGIQPGGPHVAFFLGRTVILRGGVGLNPIRLRASLDYQIEASVERRGWWDAVRAGWIYDIRADDDNRIIAFHWHPSSGRVTWPHLHAYGTNEAVDLHRLHPPTGTVTAGSVVRFLIEDLGVLPRRPNWQAVLDRHATV
jgi:hypothetical protein